MSITLDTFKSSASDIFATCANELPALKAYSQSSEGVAVYKQENKFIRQWSDKELTSAIGKWNKLEKLEQYNKDHPRIRAFKVACIIGLLFAGVTALAFYPQAAAFIASKSILVGRKLVYSGWGALALVNLLVAHLMLETLFGTAEAKSRLLADLAVQKAILMERQRHVAAPTTTAAVAAAVTFAQP